MAFPSPLCVGRGWRIFPLCDVEEAAAAAQHWTVTLLLTVSLINCLLQAKRRKN